MADKDAKTKEYMSDNERFADIFNYFIYDGEQVIDSANLYELDTTVISLPYGEEGVSDSIQKYRDVLKYLSARYDERAAYLLLGIENQSNIHYAMPVRNMLYDAGQYARQIETAAAAHRKKQRDDKKRKAKGEDVITKKISSDEYLSGFYKEEHLLPVITLVIYWSPEQWDGPVSIHDMFSVKDEKILSLVPDYKMNLITPGMMSDSDFEKFKTGLAEAFQYIKYSRDEIALEKVLKENEKFRTVDRRTAELINVITGSTLEFEKGKEVVDMCVAVENMKRKALEEGIREGKREGIREGAEKTLLESVKNLMDTMKWSAEQAMEALKVPEGDQEKYLKRL